MSGADRPVDGIIILSPSCRVLHMSPRAVALLGTSKASPLPRSFHDMALEIGEQMELSSQAGSGSGSDFQRLYPTGRGSVYVRGFGMRNRDARGFLTVLIVSERPVAPPGKPPLSPLPCFPQKDIGN